MFSIVWLSELLTRRWHFRLNESSTFGSFFFSRFCHEPTNFSWTLCSERWVRANSPEWCHIGLQYILQHNTSRFTLRKRLSSLQPSSKRVQSFVLSSRRQTQGKMRWLLGKIQVETAYPPSGNTAAVRFRFTIFTADIYDDGGSWSSAGNPHDPSSPSRSQNNIWARPPRDVTLAAVAFPRIPWASLGKTSTQSICRWASLASAWRSTNIPLNKYSENIPLLYKRVFLYPSTPDCRAEFSNFRHNSRL